MFFKVATAILLVNFFKMLDSPKPSIRKYEVNAARGGYVMEYVLTPRQRDYEWPKHIARESRHLVFNSEEAAHIFAHLFLRHIERKVFNSVKEGTVYEYKHVPLKGYYDFQRVLAKMKHARNKRAEEFRRHTAERERNNYIESQRQDAEQAWNKHSWFYE